MTGLSDQSPWTRPGQRLAYVFALGQNCGLRTQNTEPRTQIQVPAAALEHF